MPKTFYKKVEVGGGPGRFFPWVFLIGFWPFCLRSSKAPHTHLNYKKARAANVLCGTCCELRTCFVHVTQAVSVCVITFHFSLITRCLCHLDIRYQAVLSAVTMTSDADEQHRPHHYATTSKQPPHRCTTKWTDATATTTAGNWAFLSLRPASASCCSSAACRSASSIQYLSLHTACPAYATPTSTHTV
jgi:hypothetical protein